MQGIFRRPVAAAILACALVVVVSLSERPVRQPAFASSTVENDAEQAITLLNNAELELKDNAATIDAHSSLSPALLMARLRDHVAVVTGGQMPDPLLLAQLDANLIRQLAGDTQLPLGDVRGAAAVVVLSVAPAPKLYPLAVYVPPAHDSAKAAPLVIFLHGKNEAETDVVASRSIRSWADASGAIVVAPSMNGDDMLSATSIAQLYQVLDLVESALPIDRRHVYLAGDSLGGFAAFKALAQHPERWSAALVVEGAVAASDSDAVAAHIKGKTIYLVGGSNDQSVTASYMRQLAGWLRQNGAQAIYYEQPGGVHSLASVAPSVARAWREMFAGLSPSAGSQDITAPQPQSTTQHS